MSRQRYGAEMSDDAPLRALDDELRGALSVSPSPGFAARVLQRVADRSTTRTRRRFVVAPLAAAAALVIATALVLQRPHESGERQPNAPPRIASSKWAPPGPDPRVAVSPVPPANPPTATRLADRSRRRVPRAVRQASRPAAASAASDPDVIVPPGQVEAIRRLVRAIAEGTIEPPPVPERSVTGAPAPVSVQPLTIQPIFVSAAEDGGGPAPVVRPQ
jgi:hypothetical protein